VGGWLGAGGGRRQVQGDETPKNDLSDPTNHTHPPTHPQQFVDADKAAANLVALPEFQAAKLVKVNPDTPQKPVRAAVLSSGRQLLTPQPRLRTGACCAVLCAVLRCAVLCCAVLCCAMMLKL